MTSYLRWYFRSPCHFVSVLYSLLFVPLSLLHPTNPGATTPLLTYPLRDPTPPTTHSDPEETDVYCTRDSTVLWTLSSFDTLPDPSRTTNQSVGD